MPQSLGGWSPWSVSRTHLSPKGSGNEDLPVAQLDPDSRHSVKCSVSTASSMPFPLMDPA